MFLKITEFNTCIELVEWGDVRSPLGSLSTCLIHFRCLALETWIVLIARIIPALLNVCIVTMIVTSFYYYVMFGLL